MHYVQVHTNCCTPETIDSSAKCVQEIIPELTVTEFPNEITLISLATHSSGLPGMPSNFGTYEADIEINEVSHPEQRYTEDDLLEFLANYTTPPPPEKAGPEAVEYSNLGAGLLGYALEVALGTSYDQLLQVSGCCCSKLMRCCNDIVSYSCIAYSQRRVAPFVY